jgi:hypothetical protein
MPKLGKLVRADGSHHKQAAYPQKGTQELHQYRQTTSTMKDQSHLLWNIGVTFNANFVFRSASAYASKKSFVWNGMVMK